MGTQVPGRRASRPKSRLGCAECKRRRVKCDEQKPSCKRCVDGGRRCPFTQSEPSIPAAILALPRRLDRSDVSGPGPDPDDSLTGLSSASTAQFELLHHVLTSTDMIFPPISIVRDAGGQFATGLVKDSFSSTFLQNAILALAARHLAATRDGNEDALRRVRLYQARAFQTHAIARFTRTWQPVTRENCVQILMFGKLMGIHLMSDVLQAVGDGEEDGDRDGEEDQEMRHRGGDILARFTSYLRMEQGRKANVRQAWDLLLSSRIGEQVHRASIKAVYRSAGDQTWDLTTRLEGGGGLDADERHDCLEALGCIQGVLSLDASRDATAAELFEQSIEMALSWPASVGEAYVRTLEARRPEALLVLAHYAVLLHRSEPYWALRGLGRALLGAVVGLLAGNQDGWARFLRWPVAMAWTSRR